MLAFRIADHRERAAAGAGRQSRLEPDEVQLQAQPAPISVRISPSEVLAPAAAAHAVTDRIRLIEPRVEILEHHLVGIATAVKQQARRARDVRVVVAARKRPGQGRQAVLAINDQRVIAGQASDVERVDGVLRRVEQQHAVAARAARCCPCGSSTKRNSFAVGVATDLHVQRAIDGIQHAQCWCSPPSRSRPGT